MSVHHQTLPQTLSTDLFLTDGGLETVLIFENNIELPLFAAFTLLQTEDGTLALKNYFKEYAEMAVKLNTCFIFESVTWRASQDWAEKLGISSEELQSLVKKSIQILLEVKNEAFVEKYSKTVLISGNIGPRGDGYVTAEQMSAKQAEEYHYTQINTFASTKADYVAALTINYIDEAIGLVRAAESVGMAIVISFTVETDGVLPSGETLKEAVTKVDDATNGYASYFMINCSHPSHFHSTLTASTREPWIARMRGARVNASRRSHAELDECTELDSGDPIELANEVAALRREFSQMNHFGGCCGTSLQHVHSMGEALLRVDE